MLIRGGRNEEARSELEALLRQPWNTSDPATADQVGQAKVSLAAQLEQGGDIRAALRLLDDALADFDDVSPTSSPSGVIRALLLQGRYLARHGERVAALEPLSHLVDAARADERPAVQRKVALALQTKVQLLEKLERPGEALAACNDLVLLFGSSEDPRVSHSITRGLVLGAGMLGATGRYAEAIDMWTEVVDRARSYPVPDSPLLPWEAMIQRSARLFAVDCNRHAMADLETVCDDLDADQGAEALALVAEAYAHRGLRDFTSETWDRGVAKLRACANHLSDANVGPDTRDRVIGIILLWISVLLSHERARDADVCGELLAQVFDDERDGARMPLVAERMFDGARRFHAYGQLTMTLRLLDAVAPRIEPLQAMKNLYFQVQINRALILARLGHVEQSHRAIEGLYGAGVATLQAIALFEDDARRSTDPARRADLAYAMFARIVVLTARGAVVEADAAREQYGHMFDSVEDGPVQEVTLTIQALATV